MRAATRTMVAAGVLAMVMAGATACAKDAGREGGAPDSATAANGEAPMQKMDSAGNATAAPGTAAGTAAGTSAATADTSSRTTRDTTRH